jgi:hypothetical protein
VPVVGHARPLLVWWVREVGGQFGNDWECRAGGAVRDRWT